MPSSPSRDDLWIPPRASSATIRPPAKHRYAVRGSMIDDATNREIVYASTLERDLACIMLADRRIVHVADQPPALDYVDDDNRKRRHTLDFLVTAADGRKIGIAVKPQVRVASSGIERTLELIRSGPSRNRADAFVLRTDRHISRDRAADARLIIRARRTRVDDDVAAVRDYAGTMRGRRTIDAICAALPEVPAVFMRIVNLVDEGVLQRSGRGRLNPSTLIHPATDPLSKGSV